MIYAYSISFINNVCRRMQAKMHMVHNDSFFLQDPEVLTTRQASIWASERTGRKVTTSNIAYLVNYGRIPKVDRDGTVMVRVADLERYYQSIDGKREDAYKRSLGSNLNWHLSFEQYKESETTKHVHRLHPYKGKFIPQLVEYFLDPHTDEFKSEACFSAGDIILDPFCGSGTTLVQANELGMHAIGVDVSLFNSMISNLKLSEIPLGDLTTATMLVSNCIASNVEGQKARAFENDLLADLKSFNTEFFPSPEFRYSVRRGEIDEKKYGFEKAEEFRRQFNKLLEKHKVRNEIGSGSNDFMNNWYLQSVNSEINSAKRFIDGYSDTLLRDVLRLILSRTARSSRATTHSDLATLVKPVTETYYCGKHSKICKPLFSMLGWWKRYSNDTIKRMTQFKKLRTETAQVCLTGDSRNIHLISGLKKVKSEFAERVERQKIQGIFSSPPYVGMINYHEQHAYAYEMFSLPRNDQAEIGPLRLGRGRQARDAYIEGIASVLSNCLKYMTDDCDVFLVANDKFGMYPRIAELSGLTIVKEYKRPVLNRAEGDKSAYAESIFHLRRE